MGREKGRLVVLWLSLLLLVEGAVMSSSQVDNKSCHPSRCGIITNISYPFRLPNDPPHCGHRDYQLDCENYVTILPVLDYNDYDDYYGLHNRTYRVGGRYRVLGINYNNFTIRLVDEGIHKGNCSSLPLYSSHLSELDYGYPYSPYYESSYHPYSIVTPNSDTSGSILIKQVGYLKCGEAVREDAAYVDTAPCVKGGGGHLYAVAGDLSADRFQPQCRLKFVTPIASDWETMVPAGRNKSYADIHTLLSSGFELSWLQSPCADIDCSYNGYCFFSPETQSPQCRK